MQQTPGFDQLHDFVASRDHTQRESGSHCFAECREIRRNAVKPLRAVQVNPKPSDHLIEDQDDAVPRGKLANRRQVPFPGKNASPVAQDRLHDYAGDLVSMPANRILDSARIVPRQQERVRTRLEPAVVVSLEPNDAPAAGKHAGQAKGDLSGFRAGVAEDNPVRAGNQPGQPLGDANLALVLGAVVPAVAEGLRDGLGDGGVGMPQDQRPPGQRVVQVFVAVDVDDAAAPPALDVERVRNGLGAKGAADAARQRLFRPFE